MTNPQENKNTEKRTTLCTNLGITLEIKFLNFLNVEISDVQISSEQSDKKTLIFFFSLVLSGKFGDQSLRFCNERQESVPCFPWEVSDQRVWWWSLVTPLSLFTRISRNFCKFAGGYGTGERVNSKFWFSYLSYPTFL